MSDSNHNINFYDDDAANAESIATASRRSNLAAAWAEYTAEFASWRAMVTLTVAKEHWCSSDVFNNRWRTLVQILNNDLVGPRYVQKVGHSYFSYVKGNEYTVNEVVHAHILVDRPIHFSLLHKVWNAMSGFAYIKKIDNRCGAARYVSKYVTKNSDLDFYKSKYSYQPHPLPIWWITD
jgi:hypothetical protein